MNGFIQKIKIPIIAIIVIVILFYGYTLMNGGSSDAGATGLVSDNSSNTSMSQADQKFLGLLLQIQNVKIDPAIFSDQAFMSLQDDGHSIANQPQGRPNPFAPIGTDSGTVATGTSTADSGASSTSASNN